MKALTACAAIAAVMIAAPACALEIASPAVGKDRKIPNKYTANDYGCTGQNVSPPLDWKNVPAGTRSIAITMFDPDAPTGSGFWHWLIVNLPPTMTSLSEGAGTPGNEKLPQGALQTRNDPGVAAYSGPCPPKGERPHRYVFTVFAVKTDKLDVTKDTSAAIVGFNLHYNTLAKASVTYTSGRK